MKTLFACGLCLVLTTVIASASEGPLPPGKPAGVHTAGLNASTTEIAVGVAVATAIAVILAASTSSSSPATAG